MGLDLVIVTELSEDNNAMEHEAAGRIVAYIPCNWYRDSELNHSKYAYTKSRQVGLNWEFEFTESEDLVKFGKSLIDCVIPAQITNNNYDPTFLYELVDEIKKTKFFDLQLLEDNIIEEISGNINVNEVLEILIKYQNQINEHLNNSKDSYLAKYSNLFVHMDIHILEKMVGFGINLIEHANNGHRAYWSY